MNNFIYKLLFFVGLMAGFASCQNKEVHKRSLVFVNSYHQGYPPSDQMMEGFFQNIDSAEYDVLVLYMDTKRFPDDHHGMEKGKEFKAIIDSIRPDFLMTSDDAAIKFLVKPHFNDHYLPVLFCGVNWSADQYSLSQKNVTGILETLPLTETLTMLKEYDKELSTLAVLSENTLSEINNKALLDTLFINSGFQPSYFLVDDFARWQEDFVRLNDNFDVIYLPTNGAIKNWDDETAKRFVQDYTNSITFTCDDFMVDYTVFGFTKIAQEQGEWMAGAMQRIVNGEQIKNIPVSRNVQYLKLVNDNFSTRFDSLHQKIASYQ